MKWTVWMTIIVTLLSVLVGVYPSIAATATEEAPNRQVELAAQTFCDALFAGELEALRPQLNERMSAALTPEVISQILASLEVAMGKFVATRAARWEATESGNRRYRIPIEFERGLHDMLLVRDVDGKVAGLFFVAHEAIEGEAPANIQAKRPQLPKGPFPYREEAVTYESGDVTLAGTLTVPEGAGPFPALLLLSGSGAQDRNSEIFGHRPFHLWADALTRAGIAVLRMDDRGVGGSSGNVSLSTTSDFADDALVGVDFLVGRSDIADDFVGLMGHSEGGVVAPLAASRSEKVAFIILLAAPAVPGHELMALQMELFQRAAGINDATIQESVEAHRALTATVIEGGEAEQIAAAMSRLKLAQGATEPATPAEVEGFLSPWMRFFLGHDPRPALREVEQPILAINGSLDLQVDAAQNLGAIRKATEGHADVTIHEIERLNHLLQVAERGTLEEYGEIEQTLSPEVIKLVKRWILSRFEDSQLDR